MRLKLILWCFIVFKNENNFILTQLKQTEVKSYQKHAVNRPLTLGQVKSKTLDLGSYDCN